MRVRVFVCLSHPLQMTVTLQLRQFNRLQKLHQQKNIVRQRTEIFPTKQMNVNRNKIKC